ncbi:MAG: LapA family protein [Deltaproteobacteria bacterium]|nr:LapA family protein [Deltaproteobacteria bacterium]
MIRRNIIFILIIMVLIFVVQNTQIVEVEFLFWKISIPRALILFSTLAIGFICGWMLPRRRDKKFISENHKTEKRK